MAGPQPLYSDPTFGAGVGNLGTLLFGDPKVRAQAALNEKHGLYYDASAANQRSQAELRQGQIKARAGMGEAARNAGLGDAVAALIHSAINSAGSNDTSENAAQTIGNLRGQNMVAPLTQPGVPAAPPPTEMGARMGALLMSGGRSLPTKDTAITPEHQGAVIQQHENAATQRTGITAGAHLAGTKYSADRRFDADKYQTDNKPVDAGPGHVVETPASHSLGARVFRGPPQASTVKADDPVKRALDDSKLMDGVLTKIDQRLGVGRDNGRVVSGTPMAPALEQEIAGRTAEKVRAGAMLDAAFNEAWTEVVGDQPLKGSGFFGGGPQTPGGTDPATAKPAKPRAAGPGKAFAPPGAPAQQSGGADPLAEARAAIAKGANREAVAARLQAMGIDPSGL